MIISRIWTVVPGLRLIAANLYTMNGLKLGDFLMNQERSMVHAFMFGIFIIFIFLILFGTLLLMIFLNNFFLSFANFIKGKPLIISSVEWLKMNIILIRGLFFLFGDIVILVIKKKNKKNRENFSVLSCFNLLPFVNRQSKIFDLNHLSAYYIYAST